MSNPDLPLPNTIFDGDIVIASCWGNDMPSEGPVFATLLLLRPQPPFYRLFQVEVDQHGGWRRLRATERDHRNIIPATDDYSDSVGGY